MRPPHFQADARRLCGERVMIVFMRGKMIPAFRRKRYPPKG
jgi:hypothetical protein